MTYTPRTSDSAFNPDGSPVIPWDPYVQYVLDADLFGFDGKIKNTLLPAADPSGLTTEVQAAIDLAHDDVLAVANAAQTTADSALTAATNAETTATGAATDAAADAATAASLAATANANASEALALGTSAVSTAVEDYLTGVGTLTDTDGRITPARAPAPLGGVYTDVASSPGVGGGSFIYRPASSPGANVMLPNVTSVLPFAVFRVINDSAFSITLDASTGSGTFSTGGSTLAVAAGASVTFVCDGIDKYLVTD